MECSCDDLFSFVLGVWTPSNRWTNVCKKETDTETVLCMLSKLLSTVSGLKWAGFVKCANFTQLTVHKTQGLKQLLCYCTSLHTWTEDTQKHSWWKWRFPLTPGNLPSQFARAWLRGGPAEGLRGTCMTWRAQTYLLVISGYRCWQSAGKHLRWWHTVQINAEGIWWSRKGCLETRLFVVHSWADFESGCETCVRSWFQRVGFQSVGCQHPPQAHAGT